VCDMIYKSCGCDRPFHVSDVSTRIVSSALTDTLHIVVVVSFDAQKYRYV